MSDDPCVFGGYQYSRPRSARIAAARSKGTHSRQEWQALADVFGACVSCGVRYSSLHGGEPTKDHITPIIAGGCDCVANLQPVCRNCNSLGRLGDLRNSARPGWVKQYFYRIGGVDG